METYLTLKGIADVGHQLLMEAIRQGVSEFFRWAILGAGGYATVTVESPGTNDPYADETLHMVHEEGVADAILWEAVHSDWIFETGTGRDVVINDGVYVNGTLYPTATTTTGPYKHYVDFTEGRVVFDSPIPSSSLVQCSYSYRWPHFYSDETPWFRSVVLDPLVTGSQDQDVAANFTQLLVSNRIQLPAVIVEPVMARRLRGLMLGSGDQWVEQDILFHVIAERSDERNNIVDIISLQKDKTFYLFDINARRVAADYPLDWRGSPVAGAHQYPDIVGLPPSGHRWKSCFFSRMAPQDVTLQLPLYRGIVRATLEVDFSSI